LITFTNVFFKFLSRCFTFLTVFLFARFFYIYTVCCCYARMYAQTDGQSENMSPMPTGWRRRTHKNRKSENEWRGVRRNSSVRCCLHLHAAEYISSSTEIEYDDQTATTGAARENCHANLHASETRRPAARGRKTTSYQSARRCQQVSRPVASLMGFSRRPRGR